MPQPTGTRLHPITALRAIRNLKRNREDTPQAVALIDALRGKTSLRQFARFRQTETGRAVLAERRRLLDRLGDRERLAALPPGTLGRAYHDFMAAENLSAEGLVAASQIRETLPPGEDYTLFRERSRETHDLLHVVSGYGRDPLGEVCLTAFSFAQTGLKGFAVIAIWAARRIARRLPGQPVRRAVLEAYRHGRQAKWLYDADWESLLAEPVEAIRAEYGVQPPHYYPKVLAAVRAQRAATAHPATAAA
ncbi:MAG TPA: Coq4 family protein [Stellaceae bacterium]|nr:Coq4 family protein [Stellaceae bacterium]